MSTVQGQFVIGPGGEILPVEQNEDLLARLLHTDPLPPEGLSKLAALYKSYRVNNRMVVPYPTNLPLGNRLMLLALAKQVGGEIAQTAYVEGLAWADFVEDIMDAGSDESTETIQLAIRSVPVSGFQLLVETVTFTELNTAGQTDVMTRHFVIGVAPTAG